MLYSSSKHSSLQNTAHARVNAHCCHRTESGFSLLEVLISLLIFSVGFLGLASLQHVALKLSYDAVLQNSAANLAESLLTQVRVEGDSSDISAWQARVNETLPDGKGDLVKQGDEFTVTLQWQESAHSSAAGVPQEYQVRIKQAALSF